jgi:hypothetical protein
MPTPTTFAGLVSGLLGLVNVVIPAILAVVFLFLVWKIIDSWIINAGDEKKLDEGKQYAVAAVFIMVLLTITWGIVALIRSSIFGF